MTCQCESAVTTACWAHDGTRQIIFCYSFRSSEDLRCTVRYWMKAESTNQYLTFVSLRFSSQLGCERFALSCWRSSATRTLIFTWRSSRTRSRSNPGSWNWRQPSTSHTYKRERHERWVTSSSANLRSSVALHDGTKFWNPATNAETMLPDSSAVTSVVPLSKVTSTAPWKDPHQIYLWQ